MLTNINGYPLGRFSVRVDGHESPILVYALASVSHYCLLVPVSDLDDLSSAGKQDPYQAISKHLFDTFDDIVCLYVQAATKNGCQLPLPDSSLRESSLCAWRLTLEGSVNVPVNETNNRSEFMPVEGEHLFIAEKGLAITDFLHETDGAQLLQ